MEQADDLKLRQKERLAELVSYDNPHRQKYDELVHGLFEERKVHGYTQDCWNNVDQAVANSEEIFTFFRQKIGNGTFVDVGGGCYSNLRILAYRLQAAEYINVDIDELGDSSVSSTGKISMDNLDPTIPVTRYFRPDDSFVEPWPESDGTYGRVPRGNVDIIEVRADGLDMLSRMQSNSAHITANLIDFSLIHSDEYHQFLAREIARVCGVDHIAFGLSSDAFDHLENEGMTKINFKSRPNLQVFMSPKNSSIQSIQASLKGRL